VADVQDDRSVLAEAVPGAQRPPALGRDRLEGLDVDAARQQRDRAAERLEVLLALRRLDVDEVGPQAADQAALDRKSVV